MTGWEKRWIFAGSVESQLRTHCRSWKSCQFFWPCPGRRQEGQTWYLVSSVLHTPVKSIIAIRKGITALVAMAAASLCREDDGRRLNEIPCQSRGFKYSLLHGNVDAGNGDRSAGWSSDHGLSRSRWWGIHLSLTVLSLVSGPTPSLGRSGHMLGHVIDYESCEGVYKKALRVHRP